MDLKVTMEIPVMESFWKKVPGHSPQNLFKKTLTQMFLTECLQLSQSDYTVKQLQTTFEKTSGLFPH